MKLAGIALSIAVMAFGSLCYSQNSNKAVVYKTEVSDAPENRFNIKITNVNIKAVRNFKQSFVLIEDEKWYLIRDCYTVKFCRDGIQYRVDYDERGPWIGTVKTYKEDAMPSNVRRIVKREYFDNIITVVNEILLPNQSDGPVYVVHIEGNKNFKNVQVANSEMTILDEYDTE